MTTRDTLTLEAANDNPGGPTTVAVTMASLVTVMARAYVAERRRMAGTA